jgi:Domain of unknown function (DUF4783)
MKLARFLLIGFVLLVSGSFIGFDTCEDIGSAIRSGDSKQLASYFANTIDLTIINKEDNYSKTQAELIVRDFFSKNPPKSFTMVHKGTSKEGTLYGIGTLTSTKGVNFRTSFYAKKSGEKYFIQELRFETEQEVTPPKQ